MQLHTRIQPNTNQRWRYHLLKCDIVHSTRGASQVWQCALHDKRYLLALKSTPISTQAKALTHPLPVARTSQWSWQWVEQHCSRQCCSQRQRTPAHLMPDVHAPHHQTLLHSALIASSGPNWFDDWLGECTHRIAQQLAHSVAAATPHTRPAAGAETDNHTNRKKGKINSCALLTIIICTWSTSKYEQIDGAVRLAAVLHPTFLV